MARDIEDFLRRAAERRQQQMKQKQGAAPPPPPAQRPVQPPPPKPKRRPVVREDIEVVDMRQQSVQQHVKSHIDSSDIAYHAEHLADEIAQTDEKVEARIHEKFDHDLGQLDKIGQTQSETAPDASKDAVSAAALDIINLIRSPTTIRQAILMSEIIQRPNFDDE